MGTKICMNTSCGATATSQWKKGWRLKSGQIADLCFNCGAVFEKLDYCETFHYEETGWRECSLCNKRLHCGCSASLPFIEIQDFGGTWCIDCANSAGCHPGHRDTMPSSESQTVKTSTSGEMQPQGSNNKLDADSLDNKRFLCLGNNIEEREPRFIPWPQMDDANASLGKLQLDVERPLQIVDTGVSKVSHPHIGSPNFQKSTEKKFNLRTKDLHQPFNISLGTPSDSSGFGLPLPSDVEARDKIRKPLHQPGQMPRHTLPKAARPNLPQGSEANESLDSQIRIARPPAEGLIRNQLLPRYWPRITDQELQKLSGDLSSTIVPLFEKILSASDASRIGRLVLPKACAESYFPPINHSEGLPLKIMDVKENEWMLQFRFWPNNNSRMYVLEGVTPCIQSMQLQAGDTVTFSRIDPGGKLVMGFRKASNSVEKQDSQTSASHSGVPGDSSCSDVADYQPLANPQYRTLQSITGSKENIGNVLSERSNIESGGIVWIKKDKYKCKSSEDLLQQTVVSSKKKTRNISSKSKRLSMHSGDTLELTITWEEAQDLFHPPSSIQPNVIVVEEFEVEEYNEPPILGKRTLFTNRISGGQDQWAQCDKCVKWRKLPLDVLVPPKWSCSDNIWDLTRSSCFAPEAINSKELDIFFRVEKDSKRQRVTKGSKAVQGSGASGLEALADAAILEPSTGATTTRHPRHRVGCTCIVCSQPPSGKGNHKPSCGCNVCFTLKRRSKTLLTRKKRRQEVEHHQTPITEKSELNSRPSSPKHDLKSEEGSWDALEERDRSGRSVIDLNCDPTWEEDCTVEEAAGSATLALVQAATVSKEVQMNQSQNRTTYVLCGEQDKHSAPPLLQPLLTKQSEPESNF